MPEIPEHVLRVSFDLNLYTKLIEQLVAVSFLESDDVELIFIQDGIDQIYDSGSAMGAEWADMLHPGSSLMVYLTVTRGRQTPIKLLKELPDKSRISVPLP